MSRRTIGTRKAPAPADGSTAQARAKVSIGTVPGKVEIKSTTQGRV